MDNDFCNVLKEFYPTHIQCKLEQVKTYLRMWHFRRALSEIYTGLHSKQISPNNFNCLCFGMLGARFRLCESFELTALGEIEGGMGRLENIVSNLASQKQYGNARTWGLLDDLQMMINSGLIRIGSIYRCEWLPLSAEVMGKRMGWEHGEGSYSFWEWFELPEDLTWLT
jgi:hypothetical protein